MSLKQIRIEAIVIGVAKVNIEAIVIGVAKVNVVITVPDKTVAAEAEGLAHDYLRIQYPRPYAKNSILDIKHTFIDNTPKPVEKPVEKPKTEKSEVAKKPEKQGRHSVPLDSENVSRKRVKEALKTQPA